MVLQDRSQLASANRIVVKVGSSSISGENEPQLDLLVDSIAASMKRGVEVILVSSGANATGMPLLGITTKPEDLATSQALASVGQSRLIARYQQSLERYGLIAGQILLTSGDLDGAETRANAGLAMNRLVELGVLPIVNENDTVATQEIRFGDNDRLAALVAVLANADALVLLSDIDALYDMPPARAGAKPLDVIAADADLSLIEVEGTSTGVGTGGAITKLGAARVATDAGVCVLLTSAANVAKALNGEHVGTWFSASAS